MSFFQPDKDSGTDKPEKRFDIEPNQIAKDIADIRQQFGMGMIAAYTVISFLLASLISGIICQNVAAFFTGEFYISDIPKFSFGFPGILITVVLWIFFFRIAFSLKRRIMKDYHTDREGGYDVSNIHALGSADWMDKNEQEKVFYLSDDPTKIPHCQDILGMKNGKVYALRDDLPGLNKNMAVFGAPGSGKSAALVTNQIYQNILRGNSVVVTDSKGDLYTETAAIAMAHGYKVKILDLKTDEIMNSDGCDFLKLVGDDDNKAGTLAETIIKNTESGEKYMDYWAKNELNFLKAMILLVSTDENRKKMHKATLAEIYNIITTNSLPTISEMFANLAPDHPARQAYNIFSNCDPKNQGQIVNGMGIRLQVLSNRWARHVVSSDEIDLTDPMKEKCIYYCVISDTETQYKFIATLFFSELFIELSAYYDRTNQLCKQMGTKNPCLPVNFILDEFANTGAIPDFNVKISTVRSRQIGITIILQDIGQLQDMYGENLANTILNDVSVQILLKTNNLETAEHFSKLMGQLTTRTESKGYEDAESKIIHTHDAYRSSVKLAARNLNNPDEIITMNSDDLLVIVSGHHPIKLKKYFASRHPMAKEMKPIAPSSHKPDWRKKLDEEAAKDGKPPVYISPVELEMLRQKIAAAEEAGVKPAKKEETASVSEQRQEEVPAGEPVQNPAAGNTPDRGQQAEAPASPSGDLNFSSGSMFN